MQAPGFRCAHAFDGQILRIWTQVAARGERWLPGSRAILEFWPWSSRGESALDTVVVKELLDCSDVLKPYNIVGECSILDDKIALLSVRNMEIDFLANITWTSKIQ